MTKKNATIVWVVVSAILLLLLWLKRDKVKIIFSEPLPTYLDYNYPDMKLNIPQILAPTSKASCGCNPEASRYLSGVADAINSAQDRVEKQLQDYTKTINDYIQSSTFS